METNPNATAVYIDAELLSAGDMFDLFRDYQHLLCRLHGLAIDDLEMEDFMSLLDDTSELLVFVVEAGQLVALAQASRARTDPRWHIYINSVVTHDDHEGCGHGRRAIEALIESASKRWGSALARPLRFQLNNSPRRANGQFYRKLGFRPRVDDRWLVRLVKGFCSALGWKPNDETVVWYKEV